MSIIALFIVFIYAFAAQALIFSSSLTSYERTPLIYFLVLFPVVVLGVFAWLVSRHSGKLFAPGDFRDEENYIKVHSAAAASLAIASAKNTSETLNVSEIVNSVSRVLNVTPTGASEAQVLWVDDNPENNIFIRQALEAVGIRVHIALSTRQAISFLDTSPMSAIISDMGRKEGPSEGYALLDELRRKGNRTPFFIYAGSSKLEHKRETIEHGGQGTTNSAQELFQMVVGAIFAGSASVRGGAQMRSG